VCVCVCVCVCVWVYGTVQSVYWLGCVLDGPESLSRHGLDIIFSKTSSPTVGSTQPPIWCILGFVPRGESVRFELYPLTSLQTHSYLPWVPLQCAELQLLPLHLPAVLS